MTCALTCCRTSKPAALQHYVPRVLRASPTACSTRQQQQFLAAQQPHVGTSIPDQERLQQAPLGTGVVLGSARLPNNSDFRHENTIKLENNRYIEVGLDANKNTFTK